MPALRLRRLACSMGINTEQRYAMVKDSLRAGFTISIGGFTWHICIRCRVGDGNLRRRCQVFYIFLLCPTRQPADSNVNSINFRNWAVWI